MGDDANTAEHQWFRQLMLEQARTIAANQQQIIALQQQHTDHQREESAHHSKVADAIAELREEHAMAITKLTDQMAIHNDVLQQARGGWKVLFALAGCTGLTGGGLLAWLLTSLHLGPK